MTNAPQQADVASTALIQEYHDQISNLAARCAQLRGAYASQEARAEKAEAEAEALKKQVAELTEAKRGGASVASSKPEPKTLNGTGVVAEQASH